MTVSSSPSLQSKFISYYNVRRSRPWLDAYFDLFQTCAQKPDLSFDFILAELRDRTVKISGQGSIEISFASKMLATLNPNKPIWDSRVLHALRTNGLASIKAPCGSLGERYQMALDGYAQLEKFYDTFALSEEGELCIAHFNQLFPEYSTTISNTKKVDFALWCAGAE